MSKTKKFKELILRLLSKEQEVSIRSIAQAARLEKNNDTARKAIRRAIASLEKEALVVSAGTYARNILNRLLIDLSWNSSRLEGNTNYPQP